ncbi:glycosyltransferase involved in cell wall biosynthesis [Agromyces flavus]|uniref:D-inositol 3-phosphate glycosyltransferase n=1 Tax=Agromyces flavus TaxID=589382 RepID=A0A1H1Z5X3_9MICO|nr:glycosyltransferase [Agromyces flavus]MCP2366946.1 glycosyltransferase involved in cell wall biosynthesis [Agromyces flavus]GGI46710.1 glycosyl transferase [Agromyces flavus]SDT29215.1 Glycosyltransferase involved in cell wall bisynthesis [Agromyces flavus]
MTEIVLAHDYLVQVGGAERVVAEWAAGFGAREVVTLAYRPESTYEEFRGLDVRATIPSALSGQVERMLPALPAIAARTTVAGGDVALVSSSGWAHRFRFEVPHVVYVHSPARWLYAAEDYRLRLSPLRRAGLTLSTPLLRAGDADAMARAAAIVANSEVTRTRIHRAYGLESTVIHPPVEPVSRDAAPPSRDLGRPFAVVVARDRGYKNVPLAVEASREAGLEIAIVGAGSESLDDPERGVHGLGRVSDAELRWVYQHAEVVVGAGREDFGLTVLEAALEGTPAAAVAAGGYLETVRPGVSGAHATSGTAADLARAITLARAIDPESTREWGREFRRDAHVARLTAVIEWAERGASGPRP